MSRYRPGLAVSEPHSGYCGMRPSRGGGGVAAASPAASPPRSPDSGRLHLSFTARSDLAFLQSLEEIRTQWPTVVPYGLALRPDRAALILLDLRRDGGRNRPNSMSSGRPRRLPRAPGIHLRRSDPVPVRLPPDAGLAFRHTPRGLLCAGILAARPDIGRRRPPYRLGGGVLSDGCCLTPIAIPLIVIGSLSGYEALGPRRDRLSKWLILFWYFALFTAVIWWIGSTVTGRNDRPGRTTIPGPRRTPPWRSCPPTGRPHHLLEPAAKRCSAIRRPKPRRPLTVLAPERFHAAHTRGCAIPDHRRAASSEGSRTHGGGATGPNSRRMSLATWRATTSVLHRILNDVSERKQSETNLRTARRPGSGEQRTGSLFLFHFPRPAGPLRRSRVLADRNGGLRGSHPGRARDIWRTCGRIPSRWAVGDDLLAFAR